MRTPMGPIPVPQIQVPPPDNWWAVTKPGMPADEETVGAVNCEIHSNVLIFITLKNQRPSILRAFAPNEWLSVRLLESSEIPT